MNKLVILLFITTSFWLSNVSLASETPRDDFIKTFCKTSQADKYCVCEAKLRYEVLSDEQKGFMQLGVEIQLTNPDLSNDEINDIIVSTYDPTGRIGTELKATMQNIDESIKNKCNILLQSEVN